MKKFLFYASLTSILFFVATSCNNNGNKVQLKTYEDTLSYVFAVDYAKVLKSDLERLKDTYNHDNFINSLSYCLRDGEALMDDNQIKDFFDRYMAAKIEENRASQQQKGLDAAKAGEAFLAENKTKEGVITTETGLQYKIIKTGNGPKPKSTDRVEVHYTGKHLNNEVFDSSVERGQPAVFGVNQVIKGWQEALVMMPVGSKWELYIPPHIAYGSQDHGPIPANSVLIFDVELLSIK